MRRFFSTPGMDAYCGRSLADDQAGGLFHPGTAVEPFCGVGGDAAFGASAVACGASGFWPASLVGAVVGFTASLGGVVACAPCCWAVATAGSASTDAASRAAARRGINLSMGSSPRFALLFGGHVGGSLGAQARGAVWGVVVLVPRAL